MEDLKNKKLLVILESPNKISHVKKYLTDAGYKKLQVIASVGHIMKLADDRKSFKNSGVYPDEDFRLNLIVSEDKRKVVSDLKEAVKWADKIALMTDPDREGYVISWSLVKFLKLTSDKYFRAITHEITPKAVVYAIEHPVGMNENMIEAGLSRLAVDKLIGYSLSPIARHYLGCKSVGRCQSVGLKLIVDREKEIQSFVPETYFDLFLNFTKNGIPFKAKYLGYKDEKIDHLKTKAEVDVIKGQCINNYKILEINKKEKFESPKPPFCTSTAQQECANRFGLKVKDTMSILQKLFEGGFITYIRSDSTDFSQEFLDVLKPYINEHFDNSFTTPRTKKKSDTEQDGHECIRVTDLNLTPEISSSKITNDLQAKVYNLIWKRTIASALPNAKIAETTYIIDNSGHKFSLVSNEIIEEGYKMVYNGVETLDKSDLVKETFNEGEILENCNLEEIKKQTQPPARYTESSLVKELEKNGCGRPSTFATIVETVLSESRNYAKLEDKKIVPTEKGIQLSLYLDRAFPNLINLNYSKQLEDNLDLISTNKLTKTDFLNNFYTNLTESLKNNKESGVAEEIDLGVCPECGAKMVIRRSRFGKPFKGCSNYPKCKHAENY